MHHSEDIQLIEATHNEEEEINNQQAEAIGLCQSPSVQMRRSKEDQYGEEEGQRGVGQT